MRYLGNKESIVDNIVNILDKHNLLDKKLTFFDAFCGCKIERIVQAAHIYPVADIRKRNDLDLEKKIDLAIDGDNGIWLCENHHKLFDSGLIWFEEGKVCLSKNLSLDDELFIKQVTTIEAIEPQYINDRMLAFFDIRVGLPPRVALFYINIYYIFCMWSSI